ncbi:GNAT family N-acetyltransferase [Halosimplex marinum]|uniref:GNAT family N-acetyltransferase n=1 Tax=Halosimplex marinum TaxID=3396620 RepID=UPI003F55481F
MTAPAFLRGDGVTLYPTEDEDAEFCADLVNDPRVRRSLSIARPKRADAEREFRVDSDDDVVPFVVRVADDADGSGDEDSHGDELRYGLLESER